MGGKQQILFLTSDDWLSNFYPSPIALGNRLYATVEHYYQAQKFVAVPEIYEQVIAASTPKQAKQISREYPDRVREDWDTAKEGVMFLAVTAKFQQIGDLRDKLIATGDSELIENSPTDSYWGRPPHGGENRLGVIIMQVRENLRRAGSE